MLLSGNPRQETRKFVCGGERHLIGASKEIAGFLGSPPSTRKT